MRRRVVTHDRLGNARHGRRSLWRLGNRAAANASLDHSQTAGPRSLRGLPTLKANLIKILADSSVPVELRMDMQRSAAAEPEALGIRPCVLLL